MRAKPALGSLCVALVLLGIAATACGKGYKQIVVVRDGEAEFVTIGKVPEDLEEPQEVWVPGRTLVFRTDSAVPGAPGEAKGKAGRVYRINDDRVMEEVGEFELTIPNDSLAYRWGT